MHEAAVQSYITRTLEILEDYMGALSRSVSELTEFHSSTSFGMKLLEIEQARFETAKRQVALWEEASSLPDQQRVDRAQTVFVQCLEVVGDAVFANVTLSPVLYADLGRLQGIPGAAYTLSANDLVEESYSIQVLEDGEKQFYFESAPFDGSLVLEADQVLLVSVNIELAVYIAGGVPLEAAATYRQLRTSGHTALESETFILEAMTSVLDGDSPTIQGPAAPEPDMSASVDDEKPAMKIPQKRPTPKEASHQPKVVGDRSI